MASNNGVSARPIHFELFDFFICISVGNRNSMKRINYFSVASKRFFDKLSFANVTKGYTLARAMVVKINCGALTYRKSSHKF
jgi:hypothetical protein